MWIGKTLAIWLVFLFIAEWAAGQDHTTVFGQRQARGRIVNPAINEASGLVASGRHEGYFWTHNDSGDEARIFLIDDSAHHRATYYLQGVLAHDWEDIGLMEREGCYYLLIGDIGDNRGERQHVKLHVIKEPAIGTSTAATMLPIEQTRSFVLRYEDGPRDAESLFFDPLDERLYVVSKRELEVGVYTTTLPELTADTLILRRIGTLPHIFITSATISPDGSEVLMKSLLEVFYWRRKVDESVGEMLRRPAMRQPYQAEPQGEAMTFARDGSGYFTLGEAVLGIKPVLYFYPRF